MHHGALLAPTKAGGAIEVVADIAKLANSVKSITRIRNETELVTARLASQPLQVTASCDPPCRVKRVRSPQP
jgi:hypothetical protein